MTLAIIYIYMKNVCNTNFYDKKINTSKIVLEDLGVKINPSFL